jgi:predicted dehydrogenase
MELQRKLYYEKEIDFRVSRAYGPGRYDQAYEQKGRDYPIGYVRWTETRNMESFLQLLADGKVNVEPLITHSFDIDNAIAAYDLITAKQPQSYLAVLIRYPERDANSGSKRFEIITRHPQPLSADLRVGVLGAGNFAQGVLIPAIKRLSQAQLVGLCTSNGSRARSAADKFRFKFCTSHEEEIYSDISINSVVIATRHHLHAQQVVKALDSGKHVFCEKPLCITERELETIQDAYAGANGLQLMVGFNRRFAPMARRMKAFLGAPTSPLIMHYRVNAGALPKDHWINDPEQGGGRIIGEVCHFVDFLSFLCGAAPLSVHANGFSSIDDQNAVLSLEFADGSIGTIHYACDGDRAYAKERVEVFGRGRVAVLDDFRRLDFARHGKTTTVRSRLRQDKGHAAELQAFAEAICNGSSAPIPFHEIATATLTTIRIAESLRSGREERVQLERPEILATPLVS